MFFLKKPSLVVMGNFQLFLQSRLVLIHVIRYYHSQTGAFHLYQISMNTSNTQKKMLYNWYSEISQYFSKVIIFPYRCNVKVKGQSYG